MFLVTAREMQAMDRQTIENFGLSGSILMENAGRGATRFLTRVIPDIENKKVAVVAGKGNNGGDGFVIARYLSQRNIAVQVFLLAEVKEVKQGDAKANLALLAPIGVKVTELPDLATFEKNKTLLDNFDIWVDALLGTGLTSDVKGYFKSVIEYLNETQKPVFAVDIPSGLNADTGQPCGASIRAMATATFAFAKIGHYQYPGADLRGALDVVDIGIPAYIVREVAPFQKLMTHRQIQKAFRPRNADAHKGQAGHALVIAGSTGKTGAAAMAATSALRVGAGLVTLAVPASLNPTIETLVIEAMSIGLPEDRNKGVITPKALQTILKYLPVMKCVALGPGVGTAAETRAFIKTLLPNIEVPVVIDADGLNCLADDLEILNGLTAPVILTPHPGEMARLAGVDTKTVQKDRVRTARDFARQYRLHLVLKGAGTVIAHPDGSVDINTTGNPGMASGGMGDVLTGLIAGLLAQAYEPATAVRIGVYLHGLAADIVARERGVQGFLATEVMTAIPEALKCLYNQSTVQE